MKIIDANMIRQMLADIWLITDNFNAIRPTQCAGTDAG
ncbi:MAG: Uncharacterised protein [Rhodobiaceae bacterium UBA7378]|nr:MAG: Uncharacterised protein [Rhodobiaceae bacterium UBA7378]